MRRYFSLALMITMCFFAGCSTGEKSADERVLDVRAFYIANDTITAEFSLEADLGGKVYEFVLRYAGNADGGTVEVLEPENIKGIKAEISDQSGIVFEDVELGIGLLPADISPVGVMPLLMNAWAARPIKTGYSEEIDGEKLVIMETELSGENSQKTWFSGKSLMPVYAEVYSGGRTVLKCWFRSVELGG